MFRSLISLLLVGGLLWQAGYAAAQPISKATGKPSPPEGKVIILSETVGPEIDREERDRYGLFPGIPNFISAKIIQRPDGINVAWVIYEAEGKRKYGTLGVTEEILKRLEERVKGIPSTPEIEIAPEVQTPDLGPLQALPYPAPKASAIGVEFFGSVGGWVVGALVGMLVGVFPGVSSVDEENVVGLLPFGVLYASASALGSAYGVSLVGKAVRDTGSSRSAFVGGLISPLTGAILGLSGERSLEPFHCPVCGALLGSLLSPIGSTMGYALSRGSPSSPSQALLHFEGSKLQLGIPSSTFRPIVLSTDRVAWEYQVELVSARF